MHLKKKKPWLCAEQRDMQGVVRFRCCGQVNLNRMQVKLVMNLHSKFHARRRRGCSATNVGWPRWARRKRAMTCRKWSSVSGTRHLLKITSHHMCLWCVRHYPKQCRRPVTRTRWSCRATRGVSKWCAVPRTAKTLRPRWKDPECTV